MFEGLKCLFCHDLLCFPVSTHCGHNFCKECIEKVIRSSLCGIRCAYCRTRIPKKLQINRLLEMLIQQCYPKKYAKRVEESKFPKPVSRLNLLLNAGFKMTRALFLLLLPVVLSLIAMKQLSRLPKNALRLLSWLIKINLYPTSYVWQLIWTIAHILLRYIETVTIISGIVL